MIIQTFYSMIVATALLSRFPVGRLGKNAFDQNIEKGFVPIFFPLVGLLIGGVLYLAASIVQSYLPSLPFIFQASLLVLMWVWMTGGLHLDGVADFSDAMSSGVVERNKLLEIMKDPRCGAFGVVSVLGVLILKLVSLSWILQHSLFWALIIPVIARGATLLWPIFSRPMSHGMAAHYFSDIKPSIYVISYTVLLGGICLFDWKAGLLGLIVSLVVFTYLFLKVESRLGGFNGDVLGASIEWTEVFILLSIGLYYGI